MEFEFHKVYIIYGLSSNGTRTDILIPIFPFRIFRTSKLTKHGGNIFGISFTAALFLTQAKMSRRHFFQLVEAAELTFTMMSFTSRKGGALSLNRANDRMACRCLLGHLLITFAYPSKPAWSDHVLEVW